MRKRLATFSPVLGLRWQRKAEEFKCLDPEISDDTHSVDLTDGRTILIPLDWFPSLRRATPEQRSNWRLIGSGVGIHWPDLDEDLSVQGLLCPKWNQEGGFRLGWPVKPNLSLGPTRPVTHVKPAKIATCVRDLDNCACGAFAKTAGKPPNPTGPLPRKRQTPQLLNQPLTEQRLHCDVLPWQSTSNLGVIAKLRLQA